MSKEVTAHAFLRLSLPFEICTKSNLKIKYLHIVLQMSVLLFLQLVQKRLQIVTFITASKQSASSLLSIASAALPVSQSLGRSGLCYQLMVILVSEYSYGNL